MKSKYIFFLFISILLIILNNCPLNNPFQSTNLNDKKESSNSKDEDAETEAPETEDPETEDPETEDPEIEDPEIEDPEIIEGNIKISEGYSEYPKLAWTGIEFGLMWLNQSRNAHYFTIIKSNGEKKIDDVKIADFYRIFGSDRSSILWDGSNYAIIYVVDDSTNYYLYFTKIDTNGNKILTDDVLLASCSKSTYSKSIRIIGLEWTGTEYGVFWFWSTTAYDKVFFRRINTNGSLSSAVQINLSTVYSNHFSVAWNGSEYGLLYDNWGETGPNHLDFCRISSSGVKLSDNRVIQNATQGVTIRCNLIWTGSEYRIFWRDNYTTAISNWKLYSAVLNSTGVKQGTEFPLFELEDSYIYYSIAWNNNEFGIAWDYYHTSSSPKKSYFSRFDADGTKISNDIMIPDEVSDALHSSLVWTGKYYAVAWSSPAIYFKFLK